MGTEAGSHVWVAPVYHSTTEAELRELFGSWGSVTGCKIKLDGARSSAGYGFVYFREERAAQGLLAHMESGGEPPCLQGRSLQVKKAFFSSTDCIAERPEGKATKSSPPAVAGSGSAGGAPTAVALPPAARSGGYLQAVQKSGAAGSGGSAGSGNPAGGGNAANGGGHNSKSPSFGPIGAAVGAPSAGPPSVDWILSGASLSGASLNGASRASGVEPGSARAAPQNPLLPLPAASPLLSPLPLPAAALPSASPSLSLAGPPPVGSPPETTGGGLPGLPRLFPHLQCGAKVAGFLPSPRQSLGRQACEAGL